MKFNLYFKTPDVAFPLLSSSSDDEKREIESLMEKYVEYGEYIEIEFDTEKQTATVIQIK